MPYEKGQVLCDCANSSAYCLHDGKPGDGIKCMARDDWYSGPHQDGGQLTEEEVEEYFNRPIVQLIVRCI